MSRDGSRCKVAHRIGQDCFDTSAAIRFFGLDYRQEGKPRRGSGNIYLPQASPTQISLYVYVQATDQDTQILTRI
jgi:hypothetical protein